MYLFSCVYVQKSMPRRGLHVLFYIACLLIYALANILKLHTFTNKGSNNVLWTFQLFNVCRHKMVA